MNAQDFRSLQEAYLEVYDEAYKPFPKGKVDKKMASKAVRAVGHQVAATWGDKDKSSENQEKANKLGSQAKHMAQISTEKNKESNSWSRGVKSKHKKEVKDKIRYMDDVARQQRERGYGSTTKKEEIDLYDIILSHLLDEGYAETQEQAEVIMVNMSEEWRDDIVEAKKPLPVSKMKKKEEKLLGDDEDNLRALRTHMGSPERKKRMKDLQRFDNINSARTSVAKRGGKEPHPMPEVGRYKPKDED
jgi:hypothetical protein